MIVVFGSCNVDIVLRVDSHPHPGETVVCPSYQFYPGGKGANQAVAAARAGGNVHMIGCLGKDELRQLLIDSLNSANVQLNHLQFKNAPTGCATITVDAAGENMIVVASGANWHLRAKDVPDALLTPETILLLQMEVRPEENWKLIKKAKTHGCRVVLNVAPAGIVPEEVLRLLDVVIVNEHEVMTLGQKLEFSDSDVTSMASALATAYDVMVVVTLGGEGAIAVSPMGKTRVPGLTVEVVDTTGAGDTFVGYFTSSLAEGHSLEEALRRGCAAGALACTAKGAQTSIPLKAQIDALSTDALGDFLAMSQVSVQEECV